MKPSADLGSVSRPSSMAWIATRCTTFAFARSSSANEVLVDRVYTARADQPEQMKGAAVLLHLTACTRQRWIGVEASIGYGRRDAYQILHHHASGAEIEVADFAVAHLALGKTDAEPRRFEQRARAARPERVPDRGVGEGDGVSFGFRAIAPAIEYDERDWPRALCTLPLYQ